MFLLCPKGHFLAGDQTKAGTKRKLKAQITDAVGVPQAQQQTCQAKGCKRVRRGQHERANHTYQHCRTGPYHRRRHPRQLHHEKCRQRRRQGSRTEMPLLSPAQEHACSQRQMQARHHQQMGNARPAKNAFGFCGKIAGLAQRHRSQQAAVWLPQLRQQVPRHLPAKPRKGKTHGLAGRQRLVVSLHLGLQISSVGVVGQAVLLTVQPFQRKLCRKAFAKFRFRKCRAINPVMRRASVFLFHQQQATAHPVLIGGRGRFNANGKLHRLPGLFFHRGNYNKPAEGSRHRNAEQHSGCRCPAGEAALLSAKANDAKSRQQHPGRQRQNGQQKLRR